MQRGFLAKAGGALYPEGSSEARPGCWRSEGAKPKLQLHTSDREYEVVGSFKEAGAYLGKEDFEVVRNGLVLRVRGNPQNDPQSLVAGFDQSFELPLDADFAQAYHTTPHHSIPYPTIWVPAGPCCAMPFAQLSAEFVEYTLRIHIPRVQGGLACEVWLSRLRRRGVRLLRLERGATAFI